MAMKEIVSYLSRSSSAIYKLTASNGIPHYKNGRKIYFKKSEINYCVLAKRIKTMDELEADAMVYLRKNISS